MQNLMQKILHTKAFSVKLQSYGLHILILILLCLVVTKGHIYYLNKPGVLSMFDFLLPPGIVGLTGFHNCLRTCIGCKERKRTQVFRYFVFEQVSPYKFPFCFSWKRPFCNIYYGFVIDTNQTYLKRCFLQIYCILKKLSVKLYLQHPIGPYSNI